MNEDDRIDCAARGIRDKTMTDEEARAYARSALAELRKGGYAVVKQDDIAELKSTLLGAIGNIDAVSRKET